MDSPKFGSYILTGNGGRAIFKIDRKEGSISIFHRSVGIEIGSFDAGSWKHLKCRSLKLRHLTFGSQPSLRLWI